MTEYEQQYAGGDMESIAQKLIREGQVKGRSEGRTEGRAEGEREMLLSVIRQRLGSVPTAVQAQIEAASGEELQRWLVRVLQSASVDELLAG